MKFLNRLTCVRFLPFRNSIWQQWNYILELGCYLIPASATSYLHLSLIFRMKMFSRLTITRNNWIINATKAICKTTKTKEYRGKNTAAITSSLIIFLYSWWKIKVEILQNVAEKKPRVNNIMKWEFYSLLSIRLLSLFSWLLYLLSFFFPTWFFLLHCSGVEEGYSTIKFYCVKCVLLNRILFCSLEYRSPSSFFYSYYETKLSWLPSHFTLRLFILCQL